MKKVLLIMAAALMTMTQCRKQETVPATPSANTIKMTITAGPGAKTDIDDNGAIKWSEGDVLYVSDGANWLGSLKLVGEGGSASGTFTGTIQGIGDGEKTCHFFYLGHDNGMTGATGTTNAVISFASQDGSKDDALKYHLGHGSAEVTVSGGSATGSVTMRTEIAMAHLKLKMDDADYKGKVTMDVSNTMTVSPAGNFSGGGDGGITIGIGDGTTGDRYVTLIPTTGTESVEVSFSGSATGSLTFGHGIQANNLYGMTNGIEVTLNKVPVTDVSLDKTELSLEEGETETLVATVTPDNATYKDVTWSSNKTSVATVNQNGVVTAVAAGEATITVTTVDGSKTATCDVTVTAAHEYVDLGLSVKWATCNLGAEHPYDYGNYYAWGETSTKSNYYTWSTYYWCNGSSTNLTKYNTKSNYGTVDNETTLELSDDAARANWGGSWRMPTEEEFQELIDNTTCTWKAAGASIEIGGQTVSMPVAGYYCVSTKSGYADKYIFLPAAGYREGLSPTNAGSLGRYWSSSLDAGSPNWAYGMRFDSGRYFGMNSSDRCKGYSVRPVYRPRTDLCQDAR